MLDVRNYQSADAAEHERLQREVEQFKMRGGAMTMAVNMGLYQEKYGFDGYRFFRIVQIGKNSGSSNQLCLSGFELYGRVQAGRWP